MITLRSERVIRLMLTSVITHETFTGNIVDAVSRTTNLNPVTEEIASAWSRQSIQNSACHKDGHARQYHVKTNLD